MKIVTHLSKEKINSIVQLEESYNFNIDIDNKKYEATLYGYPILHMAFGRILNCGIEIKNISFKDMSILNFQVGQEIKIDDESYYVANIEVLTFYKKVEVNVIRMKQE